MFILNNLDYQHHPPNNMIVFRKFFPLDIRPAYWKFYTKYRQQNLKSCLQCLFWAYFLMVCPLFIENEFFDNFMENTKVYEQYIEIKKYESVTSVVIGTTALVTCLTKFAKIPDTIIAIISLTLSIMTKPMMVSKGDSIYLNFFLLIYYQLNI